MTSQFQTIRIGLAGVRLNANCPGLSAWWVESSLSNEHKIFPTYVATKKQLRRSMNIRLTVAAGSCVSIDWLFRERVVLHIAPRATVVIAVVPPVIRTSVYVSIWVTVTVSIRRRAHTSKSPRTTALARVHIHVGGGRRRSDVHILIAGEVGVVSVAATVIGIRVLSSVREAGAPDDVSLLWLATYGGHASKSKYSGERKIN